MSIKVIVEFHTHPGKRDELSRKLRALGEEHGPQMSGYLGSAQYEALGDPDVLIEIAEWESAEQQKLHIEKAIAGNVFAPLLELLASPLKATVVRPRPH